MTNFNRNSNLYLEDIQNTLKQVDKEAFRGCSFLVTGATGMIGTYLIDVLMYLNEIGYNIKVYALGRNKERAEERLGIYFTNDLFEFIEQDIKTKIPYFHIDYIINGASNAHPKAYQADLVDTMLSNIIGTYNVLELARECKAKVVLLSTVEVYGENKGDVESFSEEYTGGLPLNNTRQCYPESKRAAEILVQSYFSQYEVQSYILRLSRSFGPTMTNSDSKASAQFLRNAKKRQDIVLKSMGEQLFSYTYTADVASAIFFVLQKGKICEPYNVVGKQCDIKLRDFARLIANKAGTNLVFDIPEEDEKKGFSLVSKAILNVTRLKNIGWEPMYTIENAIDRTLSIMN